MRIVGVQAANICPFAGGTEHGFTIAEGIAVKQPGDADTAILRELLDEVVTVTDEQISHAIVLLLERTKLLVEGAGAASVAALLAGKVPGDDEACAILSGGNIDATLLIQVMRHGLTQAGRFLVVRTRVADRPGELIKLLQLVAEERANVVSVEHHREGMELPIGQTEVELTLAMRDEAHCDELRATLAERGYPAELRRPSRLKRRHELPQRRNSTRGRPRAAQAARPPSTPGGRRCPARPGSRRRSRRGRRSRRSSRRAGRSGSRRRTRKQAVRDVAAARDVAAVALVALAHVDQLGALLEQRLELVELDRLDPLGPGAEDVAQRGRGNRRPGDL